MHVRGCTCDECLPGSPVPKPARAAKRREAPKPPPKPETQNFYADSRVEKVGDCICLTFHSTDNGDEVEVWLPLSSAGTAAMALLEAAFGQDLAARIRKRVERSEWAKRRGWDRDVDEAALDAFSP